MFKNLKQIFLVTVNLLLILSLSACFSGGTENIGETTITKSYQGELSFLTAPFGGLNVTHLLVTEGKERVYLRSSLQDLDQYVGKDVRVTGLYFEEEVTDKKVNVLQVEKVDILSEDEINQTETEYTEKVLSNSTLGLKFSYNSELFAESSNSEVILLDGESGTDRLSIKRFELSDQLTAASYAEINYEDITFDRTQLSNGASALTNYPGSDGNLIYIVEKGNYFFKYSLQNSDEDTFQEYIEEVQGIVNSTIFTESDSSDTEEDDSSNEENNDTQDENIEITYPSFSNVDIAKQNVINNFQKQAFSLDLEGTFKDIESYAFADSGYFYVIYGKGEERRRALISYSGDDSFNIQAQYIPGTVTDWELSSGENVYMNSGLSLILVGDEEDSAKELTIEPGYRYMESITFGIGVQYPAQWYYSKVDDSYMFSDKPIGEGENLVELSDSDMVFSNLNGSTVSANIKKEVSGDETTYYVALETEKVLVIKGANTFSDKMLVMANSLISLD